MPLINIRPCSNTPREQSRLLDRLAAKGVKVLYSLRGRYMALSSEPLEEIRAIQGVAEV